MLAKHSEQLLIDQWCTFHGASFLTKESCEWRHAAAATREKLHGHVLLIATRFTLCGHEKQTSMIRPFGMPPPRAMSNVNEPLGIVALQQKRQPMSCFGSLMNADMHFMRCIGIGSQWTQRSCETGRSG